jgi:CheY-like chemotaxis protein
MDLMMPVLDGYQCLKKINKDFPPIPVIGMTSGTDANPGINGEYAGELFREHISAVFIKSHDVKKLTKYINAIQTMWINNPVQPNFCRKDRNINETYNTGEELGRTTNQIDGDIT